MLPKNEFDMHGGMTNGAYPPSNGKMPAMGPEAGGPPAEETIDIREYIDIFFRRRWMLLGTLVIIVVLGMLYTFLQPKIYQSAAQILVITGRGGGAARSDVPVLADLAALTQSRSIETQVAIITSRDLLDEAFAKLEPEIRSSGFRGGSLPSWAVNAAALRNTDIITITTQAYTPEAAAALADTMAEAYFERDLKLNSKATRMARDYVGESLAEAKENLTRANDELADFKQRTGLIDPNTQITRAAEYLATLQLDITGAKAEMEANKSAMVNLRGRMEEEEQTVLSSTSFSTNPQYAAALARIDNLYSKRAEQLQEYTEESTVIKAIDGQLAAEKAQLEALTKTIISGQTQTRNPLREQIVAEYSQHFTTRAAAQARLGALEKEFAARKKEADSLPKKERQLTALIQQTELYKGTYEILSKEFHTLKISEQSTMPNASFVTHARASNSPVKPRTATNAALFFMLGCIVAVGLALLVERLDDRVHDQETAERITGATTMAGIPKLAPEDIKLVTDADVHSHFLESFRVLRNNITFAAIDRKIKVLTVFSPGPSEGKSTICANVGIAMAMDGKRVLLIDGDLRRPALHNMFGVERERGFTTVLTGNCALEDAIVPTKIENVWLLPTGALPPNPTEVLNSGQSRELIRQLSDMYDVVIIDSPPCTKLSDVQVISTLADGLLLITALEQTLKTGLRIATRALMQVQAPLIGLVLNQLDLTSRRYGYYSYYYYSYYNYYYYSEEADGTQAKKKRRGHHRR